jgi:N-acetylglucosaminyl-diphospho-decaprenol L-rhamnosyltransferase
MIHKTLSLSIVSHGHKQYIASLISDLCRLKRSDFEVILTLNLPENLGINYAELPFPVKVIENAIPKGFAANHNAAFAKSEGDYFVVLNPDIKIIDDPFDMLLALLRKDAKNICAPLIVNDNGAIEDSARSFPTPVHLFKKLLGKMFSIPLSSEIVSAAGDVLMPDWVAGMFVAVHRSTYEMLGGLDERYHMYYEDVDFCARARLAGCQVLVGKQTKVIHNAQRDSHRKLRYTLWHMRSAFKFFTSNAYLRIQFGRLFRG